MGGGSEVEAEEGFFAGLKRRRVIRVLVLYAVAGWIVIEIASVVLPALYLPSWSVTLVIVPVAIGFPLAVVMGRSEERRVGQGCVSQSWSRGSPGNTKKQHINY